MSSIRNFRNRIEGGALGTAGRRGVAQAGGILAALLAAAPAFADDATSPEGTAPATTTTQAQPIPEPIQPAGSSDDLNAEIAKMRPRHAGILPNGPVSLIDPMIDNLNDQLDKSLGLKFGMAYTIGYQKASDSIEEDDDGAVADLDVFTRWRFFGDEKAPTRGVFGVNAEYRDAYGPTVTPKDLAAGYGGLWRSVNGFGRQEWMLTQCWWEQHLADDNIVLTFGKLDPDNYYNKNRYQSDSTTFMSQAFSSNPARKFPSNGLGANLLAKVAKDWYVTGGVQDANGDKDKSGFHTIDEGDFFGAAEVGWTPTFEEIDGKGAYRLTVWTTEEATIAGAEDDRGVALSCEQEFCKKYVPFFRAAYSDGDGTGIRHFMAGGIGLEGVVLGAADLTGVGLSWGDPVDEDLRDQFGAEVFHRFQLAPDVQLTVGYQYVVDPSYAPTNNHDPVGIFEVRVRIEF